MTNLEKCPMLMFSRGFPVVSRTFPNILKDHKSWQPKTAWSSHYLNDTRNVISVTKLECQIYIFNLASSDQYKNTQSVPPEDTF